MSFETFFFNLNGYSTVTVENIYISLNLCNSFTLYCLVKKDNTKKRD